jgi:hypothetical protein
MAMPDKAKLKVLADHGVRIAKTCGTCKHSNIPRGAFWGGCDLATYQHEKHDGARPMPAHLAFWCSSFEYGDKQLMDLGEYTQLIPWVSPPLTQIVPPKKK